MTSLRCPRCQNALVEIRFVLREEAVAMRSCSRCDRRWWQRGEEITDVDGVLAADEPSA